MVSQTKSRKIPTRKSLPLFLGIRCWSVEEVCTWAAGCGFKVDPALLRSECVDGAVLVELGTVVQLLSARMSLL